MRATLLIAASLLIAAAAPAFAGYDLEEIESARASARAGGPTSELQAYYLERYGCESGTESPACFRSAAEYHSEHQNRIHHNHRRFHRSEYGSGAY